MADIFKVAVEYEGSKGIAQAQQLGKEIEKAGTEGEKAGKKIASSFGVGEQAVIRQIQQVQQMRAEMERARQAHDATAGSTTLATRAVQQHVVAQTQAAAATRATGTSLNGLREPLTSAARAFLGLNPAVAQVTSVLGSMALGSGLMIGVLAGVAALSAAYNRLTKDAREAREEGDKVIAVLDRLLAEERHSIENAVRAAQVDRDQASAKKAKLEADREEMARTTGLGLTGPEWQRRIDEQQKLIDKADEQLRVGNEKLFETGRDAAEKQAAEDKRVLDEQKRRNAEALEERKKFYDEMAIASQMDAIIARGIPGVQSPVGAGMGLGRAGAAQANLFLNPGDSWAAIERRMFDLPDKFHDGLSVAGEAARELAGTFGNLNQNVGAVLSGISQATSGGPGLVGGLTAVGGIAAAMTGLIGLVAQQRESAAAANRAFAELTRALEDFTRLGPGADLAGRIAGEQRNAADLRQGVANTYGRLSPTEIQQEWEGINAAMDERIRLLREEEALVHRVASEDLGVRNLRASGLDDQADAEAQRLQDLREQRDFIHKFGEGSAEVLSLLATQAAEAEKRVRDLAAAIDRTASDEILGRMFSITGGSAMNIGAAPSWAGSPNAAWFEMADQYVDGLAAQKQADAQAAQQREMMIELDRAQLSKLEDQRRLTEQSVSSLRNTVETIRRLQDSLKLGPLTSLSPLQQYQEARRQFDVVANAAAGGDQTAAGRLPGAADAFLQQSRFMFSSSSRYGDDMAAVQLILGALGSDYGNQLSVAERQLAELQKQTDILSASLAQQTSDSIRSQWDSILTAMQTRGGDPMVQRSFFDFLNRYPGAYGFDFRSSDEYWRWANTPAPSDYEGGFARGGMFGPGSFMVGEQGPEMIRTRLSGTVHSASSTSDGFGSVVAAVDRLGGEFKELRKEVALSNGRNKSAARRGGWN